MFSSIGQAAAVDRVCTALTGWRAELRQKPDDRGTVDVFARWFGAGSGNDGRLLFGVLYEYVRLYAVLNVDDHQQLLVTLRENDAAAALQALDAEETGWDAFLADFDRAFLREQLGDFGSLGRTLDTAALHLVDSQTGQAVQLAAYLQQRDPTARFSLISVMRYYGCPNCYSHTSLLESQNSAFQELHCQLVLVCRASAAGGCKWLKRTGFSSPVLADETGQLVKSLNMPRSVKIMCGSDKLHKLAAMLHKRTAHMPCAQLTPEIVQHAFTEYLAKTGFVEEEAIADFYQLGGDVVIENQTGRIVFAHRCQSPVDQPDPANVVAALRKFIASS